MAIPVVFFDLETTGLPSNDGRPLPDIINIGAIDSFGNETFDRLLQPQMRVERGATRVNKFTTNWICTRLYLDGNEVEADNMVQGLIHFINWLADNFAEPVLLMAHNCHKFDGKILLENLRHYGIEYSRVIWGFSDSLIASQQTYDDGPYNLNDMLKKVGIHKEQSHAALDDAEDVRTLVRRMAGINGFQFQKFVRDERWCNTLYEQEELYGLVSDHSDDQSCGYNDFDDTMEYDSDSDSDY